MNRFNKISKKVGYNTLEVSFPSDTLNTKNYPLSDRNVVIFDDIINEPAGTQKTIANHYTDGRQRSISPIYISQSYYDIPNKKLAYELRARARKTFPRGRVISNGI